jgi:hypothetical protein
MSQIIETEDSPGKLAAILGINHPIPLYEGWHLLDKMVEHDRILSFEFLFPLIDYKADDFDDGYRITKLLQKAYQHHKIELFDYIFSQRFQLAAMMTKIWEPEFRWDIVQLCDLVEHHPNRIGDLIPNVHFIKYSVKAEDALSIIGFVEFCRSKDIGLSQGWRLRTTNKKLLEAVFDNPYLDDAEMAEVLEKLVSLGAAVSQETLENFKKDHPNHIKSIQYLTCASAMLDVKEPELA